MPIPSTSHAADRRVPVLVAVTDSISGVHSWAQRLRAAFADHPRYRLLLLAVNTNAERSPGFDLYAWSRRDVRRVLERHAPCLTLPNYVWELIELGLAAGRHGADVRTLGICHSDSDVEYYDPLEWYADGCAGLLAVSERCKRQLAARIPAHAERIVLMPYGAEPADSPRDVTRQGALRLLYAGRVVQQQKRVRDLVSLAGSLLHRDVDFSLTIAGHGALLEELRREFAHQRYGGRVVLPGTVPIAEMTRAYDSHDVLILTSDYEGTSNSMLEAMARGTVPVISRTASGAGDVVEDGRSGYLVEIGAMDTMADRLATVARDRTLLAGMAAEAHRVSQRFSMAMNRDVLTDVFDAMVAAPAPTWPAGRPFAPPLPYRGQQLDGTPVRVRRRLRSLGRRLRKLWKRQLEAVRR